MRGVALRPASGELFSLTAGSLLGVWSDSPGSPLVLRGHEHWINPIVLSADGHRIITGDWDGVIRFWDAATGDCFGKIRVPRLAGRYAGVFDLSLSPDGRELVVVWGTGLFSEQHVRRYDAWTGEPLGEVTEVEHGPLSVAHDGSGRLRVVFNGRAPELGEDIDHIAFAGQGVVNVFSRGDANMHATVLDEKQHVLRIVDSSTGLVLLRIPVHERHVSAVVFSPDGQQIVTCSEDGTAKVWSVGSGALLATLKGHSGGVLSADWSPHGDRIATASRDKSIGIWRTDTFDRVATLRGHEDVVYAVRWSPDGKRLYSTSNDRTVRIWETTPVREREQRIREREALLGGLLPRVRRLLTDLGDAEQALLATAKSES